MGDYDPHSYSPGDVVYVSLPDGWNSRRVEEWRVKRVTPTGILVAEARGREKRFDRRGHEQGERCSRIQIVNAESAAEIRAEHAAKQAWQAISVAGEAIEKAARRENEEALKAALAALSSALEARQGRDVEGGSTAEGSDIANGVAGGAHPSSPQSEQI